MATDNTLVDITPDDSVVPVYLKAMTQDEKNDLAELNEELRLEEQEKQKARESALAKLAKLGLTPAEAQSIVS